jgi:hypothetical protein
MEGMILLLKVYLEEHGPALLVTLGIATLVFWYIGGFDPPQPREITEREAYRKAQKYGQLHVTEETKEQKKPVGPFTLDEVAKHNSKDDCWIVVRDRKSNKAKVGSCVGCSA